MQIFFKNKNKNQSIRIIKAKKEKERKCTNYPRLEKKEKGTAHYPRRRAVAGARSLARSPSAAVYSLPACSLSLTRSRRRLGYHRRPTPGSQVFVRLSPSSGNEHPPGMPAPPLFPPCCANPSTPSLT